MRTRLAAARVEAGRGPGREPGTLPILAPAMGALPAIPIQRLQAVDQRLGRLVCAALGPLRSLARRRAEGPAREILLIKFWGLGSLQLLTPAVAALRRRHPGARLSLLTLRGNAELARELAVFDAVWTLDVECRSWLQIFARILALLTRLRRARFERVYDFEFFTRFSAVVAFSTGAPEVVGFACPSVPRGGLHTEEVPFNRYWHVARNFRALAGGEDGREVGAAELTPMRPTPAQRARVEDLLAAAGRSAARPLVVLNPNAGGLSLERRWPAPNFAQLARRLVLEEGCNVALIGAPAERTYVAELAARAGALPAGRLLDLAGALSIGELGALLAAADAVVSNDSGPMHLAAALGAPTIGLFGPETPLMYRPLGPEARALYRPPVCSPCINVHDNKLSTCIHGRPECLVAIGVDEVLAATRAALARREERPILLHPAAARHEVPGCASSC